MMSSMLLLPKRFLFPPRITKSNAVSVRWTPVHCRRVLLLCSVFIRGSISNVKNCKWLLVFQSRNCLLKKTMFPMLAWNTCLKKKCYGPSEIINGNSEVSERENHYADTSRKNIWWSLISLGDLQCYASNTTAWFVRSHPFKIRNVIIF